MPKNEDADRVPGDSIEGVVREAFEIDRRRVRRRILDARPTDHPAVAQFHRAVRQFHDAVGLFLHTGA